MRLYLATKSDTREIFNAMEKVEKLIKNSMYNVIPSCKKIRYFYKKMLDEKNRSVNSSISI